VSKCPRGSLGGLETGGTGHVSNPPSPKGDVGACGQAGWDGAQGARPPGRGQHLSTVVPGADWTLERSLELEADRQLRRAGKLGRSEGAFTEDQLTRRTWREETWDPGVLGQGRGDRDLSEAVIDARTWEAIEWARVAGADGQGLLVWTLWLSGWSLGEIGELQGYSASTAYRRVLKVRRLVSDYLETYPYYGLWEVYWALVHRLRKKG